MKTSWLAVLAVAACAARAPAADVARPAAAPPWCVPVTIRATAKTAPVVGLACVPTASLCARVRAAALRWGALGGLGQVGQCGAGS